MARAERRNNLNSLLDPADDRTELADLKSLLKRTQDQLSSAVEQGNQALLELQDEYDELAEKKRKLLLEIDELSAKKERLENKTEIAENLYGKYIDAIRKGKENEA